MNKVVRGYKRPSAKDRLPTAVGCSRTVPRSEPPDPPPRFRTTWGTTAGCFKALPSGETHSCAVYVERPCLATGQAWGGEARFGGSPGELR